MFVRWDESKRQKVISERGIDFANLSELLCAPYIEDQRSEVPEQYRIIGFIAERLVTFIIEYRGGDPGEYIWVVTAWKSTRQERKNYERHI